jgi:hypothetical protein
MEAKMTTSNPKPDDPAAVENWLNSHGCRLEYRTYMAFRRNAMLGDSGLGMYVESESGEAREIDVYTCDMKHGDNFDSHLFVWVICECKYSKGMPWVLMQGNLYKSGYFTDWLHTPRSAALQKPNFSQEEVEELRKSFHFAEGTYLAHNVLQADLGQKQAKSKQLDYAYDALRKISYGAWDLIRRGESLGANIYEVVFPCLVVDGPLFCAIFNPDTKQFQAIRIPYGRVCWQGCRNGTNVDVVCADALDEYAKKVGESFNIIVPLLAKKFNIQVSLPILEEIRRRAPPRAEAKRKAINLEGFRRRKDKET